MRSVGKEVDINETNNVYAGSRLFVLVITAVAASAQISFGIGVGPRGGTSFYIGSTPYSSYYYPSYHTIRITDITRIRIALEPRLDSLTIAAVDVTTTTIEDTEAAAIEDTGAADK